MPSPRTRADLIADTALALLAERGARGLTHRAVDEAAGLPLGATSNHARTRAALLAAAVRRLAERESEPGLGDGQGMEVEGLASALARVMRRSVTEGAQLTRARMELALEAGRRPELRAAYDIAGRRFLEQMTAIMSGLGFPDPDRQARSLIAWCQGTQFAVVAGTETEAPVVEEWLREDLVELLYGMRAGRARRRLTSVPAQPRIEGPMDGAS
ncbi:TetR/AcrR family transcriptional regulator [Streptomyces sp. NPDC050439]|uniref:TetR/AcrR family transcriptional regulator n=1 Tax=unclassified Streptomyces TaxID=2593676 RepID=UPI0034461CB0